MPLGGIEEEKPAAALAVQNDHLTIVVVLPCYSFHAAYQVHHIPNQRNTETL